MMHPVPIKNTRLRQFSQCERRDLNRVFRLDPIVSEQWSWCFELHNTVCKDDSLDSIVVLELDGVSPSAILTLQVIYDETTIPWRDYQGDGRMLAWSAAHAQVLNLISNLFVGVPKLVSVTRYGDLPIDQKRQTSLQAGFCIRDPNSIQRMRGVIEFDASNIRDDLPAGAGQYVSTWKSIPVNLSITIDQFDVTRCEANQIECGGFVRLDLPQSIKNTNVQIGPKEGCMLARCTETQLQIVGNHHV